MYITLSTTFLLTAALLANEEKTQKNITKIIFILITLVYSISYILASLSFLFTNQIIRGQTLLFIYQVFPKTTLFAATFILFLIGTSIIFITKRKIHLFQVGKKIKRKIKKAIIITGFIFIFLIFIFPFLFQIFNPIVEIYNHGKTIYIVPEKTTGDKILNIQTNLTNPNVIFILLESVSAERIGAYGYNRNITPNIDHLAKNGILFENVYATATHSDYAQPAYLSSRYMLSNRYRNFFKEKQERKNAWEIFKNENYSTAYISSQNDLWAGMNEYFNLESLDKYSYSLTDGKTDYGTGLAEKDYDHKTMDEALLWINKTNKQKPFFLYTNLQATHVPMDYPEEYAHYKPDKISAAGFFYPNSISTTLNRYDNSLKYVDLQIGRLLESLKEREILNNTVIIISADHGHDFLKRHNTEGHGLSVYNEELKVPLIFFFPDLKPKQIKSPVSHIDVLPTVIDILGKNIPEELIGKPMETNSRIFFYTQNHKYMIGMLHNNTKIIIDLNKKTVEAYNILNDPEEKKNLIGKNNYDQEILELLLWNDCQKEYFSKELKNKELEKYCENFR
jgi:arylsulfatase